ncbi:MAG: phosphatidate cytidylyltransferase [Chitinophagaceae bacterium]|nr:phosphatidate cytidylyltransferase [Chitinophagaceae bacterium]MDB5221893.1 phosphatidate cytidylyltransferase [Chitinophagaceae bacterium]
MAFNLQAFKTRALTAIIFAVVMVGGLLWNQWSFIILFTVIHFGCWYEFVKLIKKIDPEKFAYYLLPGLIYITMPVLMMIHLFYISSSYHISLHNFFPVIPCAIIFSIWINDTMAYIVGSFIGKTPFSKISAKKTWEGTLGGAILCIVIMAAFGLWNRSYSTTDRIIIPSICAVFGTLGDLLESKLKRMAQVKDSGTIMPGHGGFLDRFDSLLIAIPFVWLYVYFFMR